MKSILKESLKENFYIKRYFNSNKDLRLAAVKRAYLDFCRTLHRINETDEQREENRNVIENYLLENLSKLVESKIMDQQSFDERHKNLSINLKAKWPKLTIGQAQKWINMTLKYWLLLGNQRINSIEKNAKYFHIPIDSYVQKGMFKEKNPPPWSKINDYETYMNYQNQYRRNNPNTYPIIDEFIFFNNL